MQRAVARSPLHSPVGGHLRAQGTREQGRLDYQVLALGGGGIGGVILVLNWLSWDYKLEERRPWASLLVLACLLPAVIQMAKRVKGIEILPVVAGFYFLHFAFPSFLSMESLQTPNEAAMEYGLQLCCAGLIVMMLGNKLGMKVSAGWKIPFPQLDARRTVLSAVVLLVASTAFSLFTNFYGTEWSGGFKQILYYFMIPYLPLALLLLWDAQKGLERRWQLVVMGCVLLLVTVGALQGSLAAMMRPLLVYVMARWAGSGRIPIRTVLILVCLYFLLQPAKAAYRDVVWFSDYQGSVTQSLGIFADSIFDVLQGDTILNLESATTQTGLNRLDSMTLMTQVVRLTPDFVPYQEGQTYSYFLYTLIPRFIWPDKPIAREANDWFALTYGFSTEDQIGQAVVGMPQLTEGFINFGPWGIVGAGLVFGLIYGLLTGLFRMNKTGVGGCAILITLLIGFTNIETSTGQLFSGIIQQTAVYALLLWIIRVKDAVSRSR